MDRDIISREETMMAKTLDGLSITDITPVSRTEVLLKELCEKVSMGGVSKDEIKEIIRELVQAGEISAYDDTQIKLMIGTLDNLTTTDKTSLVNAINEVLASGGGSGTTDYVDLTNKPSINGVELDGNKSLSDLGITNYDDTQVKTDISTNKSDIADLKTDKQDNTDNTLNTTDKTVVGAINEVNGNLLDTVGFSADYKNIILNRKNGLNPYTIPIAAIIGNTSLTELKDIDSTDIGNGKTIVYDSATQKHKYVDSTGTDELVKMEASSDAHYLSDLIDKSTVVNDNGVLKVKKLDGQEVTITEINYLKGLIMNVMDLVNMFSNGGVKIINTPVNTYADLLTYDKTSLIDGISYLLYVLADETHDNAKTTYLIDKTSSTPTYFGFAGEHRDFITNPIDLANEVTGKLPTDNIDVDSLWSLLTINDTYKTLTTNNEVFGTHGAKALYDELVADIGGKANTTDLTSHTNDTDIHITTSERTKWNEVDNKVDKTDITTTIDSTSTDTQVPSAKTIWNNLSSGMVRAVLSAFANEDILAYADNITPKSNCEVYIVRFNTCQNAPSGVVDCFCLIRKISNVNWIGITLWDIRTENVYEIRKTSGTWGKWKRLCTTSVADVPFTKLTLDSSVFTLASSSESYFSYSVCNGMCTITCKGIALVSVGSYVVTSDIPKPVGGYASNILQIGKSSNVPTNPVYLVVNDDGLTIMSNSHTGPFWGTLTYPVAES